MGPEVETRYGRLRGTERDGVRAFRGVRFAHPPSGAHRFRPPLPPTPWTGVREARQPGPAAPQHALPFFGWISAAGVAPGDDCLSLNVWTPGLDEARRPVLVWIHGGGFMVGAGSTAIYDGHDLARRGDAVVVTINYRLGALGYLHLASVLGEDFAQSSNLGVRDQIAALEWVREHIDRFGGDPGNVTVFGQSAGAMSIGALLGAPRARALFHKVVCQSGAASNVLDAQRGHEIAERFLQELGGPAPTHEALGRVPIGEVMRAQRNVMATLADLQSLMVFLPVVDGELIPEQPLDAIRRGEAAHLPLLTGTTLDEWRLFRLVDPGPRALEPPDLLARFDEALGAFPAAPEPARAMAEFGEAVRDRSGDVGASEIWSAFQSARIMHFPATRLAEAWTEGGGRAYAYLFAWRPPGLRRALGACHGLDIPFVFGAVTHPLVRPLVGFGAPAQRLARKMQRAWIGFARDGSPEHGQLATWQPYEPQRRTTLLLAERCALTHAPLERERELLAEWYGGTQASGPGPRRRRPGGRGSALNPAAILRMR